MYWGGFCAFLPDISGLGGGGGGGGHSLKESANLRGEGGGGGWWCRFPPGPGLG